MPSEAKQPTGGSDATTADPVTDLESASTFEINLVKPSNGSLGIKIDGDNVVSKITPGGAVCTDGRMRVGDRIIRYDSSLEHARL